MPSTCSHDLQKVNASDEAANTQEVVIVGDTQNPTPAAVEQRDDNAPPANSPAEALAAQLKEVEDYLKLPQVSPINDDGTDFDLLAWWKARQAIFPHLRKMARLCHEFPATSACVERLFSAAGRMHSDLKKSTSDTTLEHSLLVHKNLE
eukprot:jgi/Tetstr1/425315/TSEL_015765.t1